MSQGLMIFQFITLLCALTFLGMAIYHNRVNVRISRQLVEEYQRMRAINQRLEDLIAKNPRRVRELIG